MSIIRQELHGRLDRVLGEERIQALLAASAEASDVEKELAAGPTKILHVHIEEEDLVVTFDKSVPPRWATAFRNIGSFSYFGNFSPSSVVFDGTAAARLHLQSRPDQADGVFLAFKNWFAAAKSDYARLVRSEAAKREAEERSRMEREIEYEKKKLAAQERLREAFNRMNDR